MRFYNVDHQGKHLLQRLSGHPSDEEGRLYYHTGDNAPYISNGSAHHKLVKADGGSYNINATKAKYS
jgi:hypothetical protein